MNFFELKNQSDFELAHIFECGQCFRWNKNDDGSYTGVIKDGVLNVKKVSGNVEICTNIDDFSIVSEYLDLGTDYSKIKKNLLLVHPQTRPERAIPHPGPRIFR